MSEILSLFFSLLIFLFPSLGYVTPAPLEDSQEVTVVNVIDGDTIDVSINGEVQRVRYIGVDTPEPDREGEPECFGTEASEANKALVANKTVRLVSDVEDKDKYDRLLRYVYVDDIFINAELIKGGYAKALPIKPNTKHAREFKSLQLIAKDLQLGLWGSCF